MKLLHILFCFIISTAGFSQVFQSINSESFSSDKQINCFTQDEYALWLGCNSGIYRISFNDSARITEVSHRKTSRPVLALLNDGKILWASLQEKGLYIFDKTSYQFKGLQKNLLADEDVVFIHKVNSSLQLLSKQNKVFSILLKDTLGNEITSKEELISSEILNRINGVVKNDWLSISNTSVIVKGEKLDAVPFQLAQRKLLMGTGLQVNIGAEIWKLDSVTRQFKKYETTAQLVAGDFYKVGDKQLYVSQNKLLLYDELKDTISFKLKEPALKAVTNENVISNNDNGQVEEKANEENDQNSTCAVNNSGKCSTTFILLIVLGILVYTFLIIYITARNYKKDIFVLEEEVLRLKKKD